MGGEPRPRRPITRLVSGDAALAFEGSNIVLEERSRRLSSDARSGRFGVF